MAAILDLPDEMDGHAPPEDPRVRALRDVFVSEYLVDFDQIEAAKRCGFGHQQALEWGPKMFGEPYVARRIRELQAMKVDQAQDEEYNQARIKARLLEEAHYKGPGSSHSARVTALATLAKMYKMENGAVPQEVPGATNQRGGVMRVPGIASADAWEATAQDSQTKLVTDARK